MQVELMQRFPLGMDEAAASDFEAAREGALPNGTRTGVGASTLRRPDGRPRSNAAGPKRAGVEGTRHDRHSRPEPAQRSMP
jgi:hypothetical protein